MEAPTPKSSVEQIRQRFDNDVERFSNLETGQVATIDAPLMLDLVSSAAAVTTPGARAVLDVVRGGELHAEAAPEDAGGWTRRWSI